MLKSIELPIAEESTWYICRFLPLAAIKSSRERTTEFIRFLEVLIEIQEGQNQPF
jgi:hypothetical protein